MSFFTQKRAIENASSRKDRRNRKRSQNADVRRETNRRLCRFEELEKRELLAADPISVGVVYAEQGVEALGDKFYVAWVGGEVGSTTLDSLTINLDKNGNGALDDGETFFDVSPDGSGVYSSVPFTVVEATDGVGYSYEVADGGTTLTISFTNFKAGDKFVFTLDVDEYQTSVDGDKQNDNSVVEGGEFGGSVVKGIAGSTVSATFSSERYQTETWVGSFVDDYDGEYERAAALSGSYDAEDLPFDLDDQNEGIWHAGVYAQIDLTPKPVVISGYVYGDRDVDCNYDVGQDDPLANVELTLVAKDGRTWTTTTDANGYYEFNADDILPGEYEIVSQCDVKSPEGLSYFDFCAKGGEFGEKIDPLHIKIDGLQGGDVASDNNFAKALIGTISGNVFEDRNDADGKNDGETWDGVAYPAKVELWRVDVDADGNVVKTLMETQTVDAAGGYRFVLDGSYGQNGELRKLVEKTYELREIFDSADYSDGKDYVGTLGGVVANDVFGDVYVGYGEHGYNYDFGELKLGSIAGNVFEDRNDNGVFDAAEAGISGVTVELYQWNGADYVKIAETTTDENGAYRFDDLDIEKEYAVKELQPTEYSDGKDAVGSLGGALADDYVSKIEIGWDQHGEKYDFGELKLGAIAGNVFEDRNDDGVFDAAEEPGIANVTVELYQWDGADYVKIAETQTAADGSYVFENLDINRQYAVKEKQPEAYSDGKDAVGSLGGNLAANDYTDSIDVQWDERGENYDFGELKLGSVSGYVYHDKNDDGVRDEGEPGVPGATVELYRLDGEEYVKIAETTTDENGFYKFDALDIERTYAVKEIQPDAWDDGKDAAGSLGGVATNDKIDNIDVYWDAQGVEYNFGELLPPGSLSGYVYEDDNNDGLRGENEAPIKDVVLSLYVVEADGTATLVATQKTDENGYYEFNNLAPERTYIVRETQPDAYFDGKETVGTIFGATVGVSSTNDEIAEIELPRRGDGVEYNFGELRPASIAGNVYEDDNDDGVFDDGEAGIKGATLTLWILDKETGEYVATGRTVQTNADGAYLFDGLEPNRIYRVVETQPSGYDDGKDAVGSLGGEMKNDDLFAISVQAGDAGVEYNFGELPIPEPEKPQDPEPTPETPPRDTIPDAPGVSLPVSIPSNYWGASPTHFPYTFNQPYIPGATTTLFGGGGLPAAQSWRLSVLNGGSPRSIDALTTTFGFRGDYNNGAGGSYKYVDVSWSLDDGFDGGEWLIRGSNGEIFANYKFGAEDAKPIVGDWNGDGADCVGIYVDGRWFLDRNGDGKFDEEDLWAELGSSSDQPVSGDWDGDGKADIGIFGPQWATDPQAIAVEPGLPTDHNRTITVDRGKNVPPSEELFSRSELNLRATKHRDAGQVRVDLIDHVFQYGNDGDVALTGDWTGDGVAKIGVYRNGDWYFDMNGDGRWNDGDVRLERMGGAGYRPIVGDFDGDGVDSIGLFSNGDWLIDSDGDRRFDASIRFGQAGDVPVVGDFNGDGVDELAVYRPGATDADAADAPRQADAPVESPVDSQVAESAEGAALQR